MKKVIALALVVLSTACTAAVQTNFVYVVTNIYQTVYSESVVTQKVKNTHYNYYYTNHVYTVSNVVVEVSRTNLNINVVWDNFGPWVNAASNSAAQAAASAANAQEYAGTASWYASNASSSSSAAQSFMNSSQAAANRSEAAAQNGLSNINERIAWFDTHAGETITQITTNINMTLDPAVSFPYVWPDGVTTNDNIRFYPVENANGKVCGTPISSAAATAFSVAIGKSGTAGPTSYEIIKFDAGWADSDSDGMKIHYCPRDRELRSCYVSSSLTRLVLARDFYWQAGRYFVVFDIYNSATNWETRLTFRSNQVLTFPDHLRGSSQDTTIFGGGWLNTFMSKYAERGTSRSPGVSFKTEYQSYLTFPTPIWIPARPSAEHAATIEWINSFPTQ